MLEIRKLYADGRVSSPILISTIEAVEDYAASIFSTVIFRCGDIVYVRGEDYVQLDLNACVVASAAGYVFMTAAMANRIVRHALDHLVLIDDYYLEFK